MAINRDIFFRSRANPILIPDKTHNWESKKVYNCGAIYEPSANKYHIYYRAVGTNAKWHSSIGYATSSDGEYFERFDAPVFVPTLPLEKLGVEDPRVVKIGDRYYMTYTAYDGDCARLLFATSDNLHDWERRGEIIPQWDFKKAKGFQVKWDEARYTETALKKWIKSGGIFSEKIDGKYWMIFGDSNVWLAYSKDCMKWKPLWEPFIKPREGFFDSVHIEMGPPPIKTDKGWLVLYHGIDEKIVYRIGLVLLDLNNPRKIIFRSSESLFQPREPYELSGIVDILPGGLKGLQKMTEEELNNFLRTAQVKGFMPKVTFCCGAIASDHLHWCLVI